MKDGIVRRLKEAKVVPVIRHDDRKVAGEACALLAESGVSALEVTMSVPDATSLLSEFVEGSFDGLVGAGTVCDAEQARQVVDLGVDFVVSPCWVGEVAEVAMKAGTPYLPGALTPGEILAHSRGGAAAVKVFPAESVGGPKFIQAMKAVFPDIPLMPTGGVTPENADDYLTAGAFCVGIGGNLQPSAALEAGDHAEARRLIVAALGALGIGSER